MGKIIHLFPHKRLTKDEMMRLRAQAFRESFGFGHTKPAGIRSASAAEAASNNLPFSEPCVPEEKVPQPKENAWRKLWE